MDDRQLQAYEELKKKIMDIGIAIPGTLREMYHRCGRDYCQCMVSDKHKHGPYHLWDRKIDGKLSAMSIQQEEVELYQSWINNRKILESVIIELLDWGCHYATDRKVKIKTTRKKSKKNDSSTRGK